MANFDVQTSCVCLKVRCFAYEGSIFGIHLYSVHTCFLPRLIAFKLQYQNWDISNSGLLTDKGMEGLQSRTLSFFFDTLGIFALSLR